MPLPTSSSISEQSPLADKKKKPLSRRERGALLELAREPVSAEALRFDHQPKKNKKTKRGRKPDWKKAAYYAAQVRRQREQLRLPG